jgi:hypothetical protein
MLMILNWISTSDHAQEEETALDATQPGNKRLLIKGLKKLAKHRSVSSSPLEVL